VRKPNKKNQKQNNKTKQNRTKKSHSHHSNQYCCTLTNKQEKRHNYFPNSCIPSEIVASMITDLTTYPKTNPKPKNPPKQNKKKKKPLPHHEISSLLYETRSVNQEKPITHQSARLHLHLLLLLKSFIIIIIICGKPTR
jgi:hypothetical protein